MSIIHLCSKFGSKRVELSDRLNSRVRSLKPMTPFVVAITCYALFIPRLLLFLFALLLLLFCSFGSSASAAQDSSSAVACIHCAFDSHRTNNRMVFRLNDRLNATQLSNAQHNANRPLLLNLKPPVPLSAERRSSALPLGVSSAHSVLRNSDHLLDDTGSTGDVTHEETQTQSDFRIRPVAVLVQPKPVASGQPVTNQNRYRSQLSANGQQTRQQRKRMRAHQSTTTTTTSTTTTTAAPADDYYEYDDYYDDEYSPDGQPLTTTTTTTTTTTRPPKRRRGRRRFRRPTEAPTTTTSTTTLSPNYRPRPDGRVIDFLADPNFPYELKGSDLTEYPFYISIPESQFECKGRHDGYYADIDLKCQVYHHCAVGHQRYDFLCPNYTLFDQTTFTCRFINTVDCLSSESHYNRNNELYVQTTTTTTTTTTPTPTSTPMPIPIPIIRQTQAEAEARGRDYWKNNATTIEH